MLEVKFGDSPVTLIMGATRKSDLFPANPPLKVGQSIIAA